VYTPAGESTTWLAVKVNGQEKKFYGEKKLAAAIKDDAVLAQSLLDQILSKEATFIGTTEEEAVPFDLSNNGLEIVP
jgi:hypothetical protein